MNEKKNLLPTYGGSVENPHAVATAKER